MIKLYLVRSRQVMLNFNDEKLNKLVANFIHYMVDTKHDEGKQFVETDY